MGSQAAHYEKVKFMVASDHFTSSDSFILHYICNEIMNIK